MRSQLKNADSILGERSDFKRKILKFLSEQRGWKTRSDLKSEFGEDTKGYSNCIGQHTKDKEDWEPDSLLSLKLVRFKLVDPSKPKGEAKYKITTSGRRLILQEGRPTAKRKPKKANRSVRAFRLPDEVFDPSGLPEGAVKAVVVNAFERKRANRQKCIKAHGVACSVCEMEFGAANGLVAKGYIHVHHLRPLSEVREAHQVDPINDLRPVCPNCHAVLHMGEPLFSIEDVRGMLRRARKG